MNRLRFRKLQTQILLAFALLLAVAQAASLLSINRVLTRSTREEVRRGLVAGESLFRNACAANEAQLVQAAKVLASDYAFRQAVGTSDHPTIRSALANHGSRIHAPVMILAGLDGKVVADTLDQGLQGRPFPLPALLETAEAEGEAGAIAVLDGSLYQIVVVPVLAPLPIGWLGVGTLIGDDFTRSVQALTGLDISFVSRAGGRGWHAHASTLDNPKVLADLDLEKAPGMETQMMGGEAFATVALKLETRGDRTTAAILQRSLRKAQEPLRRLQAILLLITALSLGGTLLAGVFFARGITRPVKELVVSAERIQVGDYSRQVLVARADEIGSLAAAFNHMMGGLAAREDRITELAFRDQLTGLPNRILFRDRLGQEIRNAVRSGKPFTVLFVDLDRFREVNDIMGHHVGDLLLVEVARRLGTEILRDPDVLARLGGDEFAVLLPGTDIPGAMLVAQRMSDILKQPVLLEGQNISLGGGIGLAAFPEHGEEDTTLLRHAEQAMYEAKRHNTGFSVFASHLDAENPEHLSLMDDLRRALEQRELVLYYQPKLDLARNVIAQAEALVRWRHPERGLIPPGKFTPYAEKTGFIKRITEWALGEALAQAATWKAQGLPMVISVNLSARDLMNTGLPELIADQLAAHGATPDGLILEITESAIMADPAGGLAILHRLDAMGLRLSIDDFGTGYSSLAYLKKLPVAELKIDQSFVTHMAEDRDDEIIVRSTIDLGHNMGLKVVAEGVEDQVALELLRSLGCDVAQGYHIARPMPAGDLVDWIGRSPWAGAPLS